jgi:hypothetical protein
MPTFYHRSRTDESPLGREALEALNNSRKASSNRSSESDPANLPANMTQQLYDCYHDIAVNFNTVLRGACDALWRKGEPGQPFQRFVEQLKIFSEAIDHKRNEYLPDIPEETELLKFRRDILRQLVSLAARIDDFDEAELLRLRQEALAPRQPSQSAGIGNTSAATGTNLQAPAEISNGQAVTFDAPLQKDGPPKGKRLANQSEGLYRRQKPMIPRTASPNEYSAASTTTLKEPHPSTTRPPTPPGLKWLGACLGIKKSSSSRKSNRNTQAR